MTTDQTINRASAALAGALAADDPDLRVHFIEILSTCFTESHLSAEEFDRQACDGIRAALDQWAPAAAQLVVRTNDEDEIERILHNGMLDALRAASCRVMT
jgi:hypothetical protein